MKFNIPSDKIDQCVGWIIREVKLSDKFMPADVQVITQAAYLTGYADGLQDPIGQIDHRSEVMRLEKILEEIEAYCLKHPEQMWAATVWSMYTGKDFREIPLHPRADLLEVDIK